MAAKIRIYFEGDRKLKRGFAAFLANDEHAQLMVQIMESWFLADKEALGAYYDEGFRVNRLPATSRIEDIPKESALRGLNEAAAECRKGKYHKTHHASDLLARIDPAKVRAASPWCNRLFQTIEETIEGP